MRLPVKFLLFISSYTPLFLILAIKAFGLRSWLFVTIVGLILLNCIWLLLYKMAEARTDETYKIAKSSNIASTALEYIVSYVIILISFSYKSIADILIVLILISVIFIIFVRSNLMFVNPVLFFFGFTIHEVETAEGGVFVVLSKSLKKKEGEVLNVKRVSEGLYWEVDKNDRRIKPGTT